MRHLISVTSSRLYVFIGLSLLYATTVAQIIPEPGAQLNYTQVMFEHPQMQGATDYLLEVAAYTDPEFKHLVAMQKDSSTAVMVSNLQFGQKYAWRYAGLKEGKKMGWAGPYNFEIMTDVSADKMIFRARVLQNDTALNAGGLIVLDMTNNIIDRNGNTVWFMPVDTGGYQQQPDRLQQHTIINDMRVTPGGTVTLLNGTKAEERDLMGHVLCGALPANDDSGLPNNRAYVGYNHCFKKLGNGNYMAICAASAYATSFFTTAAPVTGNAVPDVKVAYEILKEFDKNGNVVWSWSSETYFDSAELKDMMLSAPDIGLLNTLPGGHMNAFDVDEKNGFVYAGFRNVSRVIKIDKKTGKVVCAWGAGVSYNGAPNGDHFFSKQHETALLHDGTIAVFNNDMSDTRSVARLPTANGGPHNASALRGAQGASSAVIFTQPSDTANSRVLWKLDCRLDSVNYKSLRGGNVSELKNGNLLICMGGINRVFEATRDKRVVWSAVMEKYETYDSSWRATSLYRAYYTSSLYPCYFTVQTSTETLKKNAGAFQLRIFNDGTEDDLYRVTVSSQGGSYKKEFTTDVLRSRKSINVELTPDNLPAKNDKITVMVQSVTNADFKRVVDVQYVK